MQYNQADYQYGTRMIHMPSKSTLQYRGHKIEISSVSVGFCPDSSIWNVPDSAHKPALQSQDIIIDEHRVIFSSAVFMPPNNGNPSSWGNWLDWVIDDFEGERKLKYKPVCTVTAVEEA